MPSISLKLSSASMLLMIQLVTLPSVRAQQSPGDVSHEAKTTRASRDSATPGLSISGINPTEGSSLGGEILEITGLFSPLEHPLEVTLGGVVQQLVSRTGDHLHIWTVRLDSLSCDEISAPIVVTDLATGEQRVGPVWTFLPPSQCRESSPCIPEVSTLCLHDGRFSLEVDWIDHQGNSGRGQVASASGNSGAFWFFDPKSWEMHAKVVDGCDFNDHLWFFSAASTNAEFLVRVADHVGGATREYSNSLGTTAEAITDTTAFSECLRPVAMRLVVNRAAIGVGGGEIFLLATAISAEGLPVPGATVEFRADAGTFQAGTRGSVETNLAGQALEVLTVTETELQALQGDETFTVTASVSDGSVTVVSELTISVFY